MPLLQGHARRQIPRLVNIAASADGYVVGEELEGDYFEDGQEKFVRLRDADGVLDELGDAGVAFDGDDAAGAGGDFLDARKGFFVLEHAGEVLRILSRDADGGQ